MGQPADGGRATRTRDALTRHVEGHRGEHTAHHAVPLLTAWIVARPWRSLRACSMLSLFSRVANKGNSALSVTSLCAGEHGAEHGAEAGPAGGQAGAAGALRRAAAGAPRRPGPAARVHGGHAGAPPDTPMPVHTQRLQLQEWHWLSMILGSSRSGCSAAVRVVPDSHLQGSKLAVSLGVSRLQVVLISLTGGGALHQDGKGFVPVEGHVLGRSILCELQQDTRQLEANIEAIQRTKCTFFCVCMNKVSPFSSSFSCLPGCQTSPSTVGIHTSTK